MKKTFVVLLVCIMILGLATIAQAAQYPETTKNLVTAVTGETGATAHYRAFADVAKREGHRELGRIFQAISDAEEKHAADQFVILRTIDPAAVKPVAGPVNTGTTRQNLQFAIDGETYEYRQMYPPFVSWATSEDHAPARQIFRWAMRAEEVHANIYTALLADFPGFDRAKYETLFRCLVCGNIFFNTTPDRCPICNEPKEKFVDYEISNKYGCNVGLTALALGLIPFIVRRRK